MTDGSQEQEPHPPSADAVEVEGSDLRTPLAQGTSFEAAIHETVGRFAAVWGDAYIDTARDSGRISRCRKGDGVLTVRGHPGLAEPAQVVLEMTTEKGVRRDWVTYLEEAERNRAAQASLGVVPNVAQVPGGEIIRIYGNSRMVVAFDPAHDEPTILRYVLFLLRYQAITAASRRGVTRVDAAEEKLAEAITLLDKLDTLHHKATIACANVDQVAGELIPLRSRLLRALTAATEDLGEAGGHGAPSVPAPRPATTDPITLKGSPR